MQATNIDGKPIKDRYNMVYLILLLHGVGILMPWNMFITGRSYFVDYKLSKNYTGEDSSYATWFLSYVGFASQIPIIIFNWINVFINIGGSVSPRIVLSLSVEIIMLVITIILAITNTSHWLSGFFWSTMVTIVLLNKNEWAVLVFNMCYSIVANFPVANGIYQNTIFGMAAKLPFKHTGAIILGCNISGVLVSFIDLLTIVIAPSIKTAAICYFITPLIVLLSCLVTYFTLPNIKFYKHYEILSTKPLQRSNEENTGKIPYWAIFKKVSSQLFNVFFVFFVTLSIFPAMQADIKKSDPDFVIPKKYYENIMCFFTFNMTAMMGCIFSHWVKWPSPKLLLIPVLLRVLFIPFFFFCNYQPTNKVRRVPVLIPNDWVYWFAGICLGFTSGYLSSKAMIYTSGSLGTIYDSISGMFGAAVLVTGIFSGVIFSMIFPWLVEL